MQTEKEQSYPNVAYVRMIARREWEKQARKRLTVQERVGEGISWFVVVVAAVFFLLSAPHTAKVFGLITPWLGYAAPVGVECGQLSLAYMRKYAKANQQRVPLVNYALEVLLFVTAIIVNGAGSLAAVVSASEKTQSLSLEQLVERFGALPAQNQVALILVPIAALIIPIGTTVAGESFATMFFERKQRGGGLLDERWQSEGPGVEYHALRDAAIGQGVSPAKAARWAAQITGYASDRPLSGVVRKAGPDTSGQVADEDRTPAAPSAGQGYTKTMDARERVRRYLADNPDATQLTVRTLADLAGVGKTVAAEELQAHRNGHHNGRSNGHYPGQE